MFDRKEREGEESVREEKEKKLEHDDCKWSNGGGKEEKRHRRRYRERAHRDAVAVPAPVLPHASGNLGRERHFESKRETQKGKKQLTKNW